MRVRPVVPRRRLRTAGILVGAVTAVLATACGGSGGTAPTRPVPTDASTTAASTAASTASTVATSIATSLPDTGPVRLHVPDGWVVSADGRTVAEDAADLVAAVPSGPAVRAVLDPGPIDPRRSFAEALAAPDAVVAGPEPVVVDGRAGVAVTVRRSAAAGTPGSAVASQIVRTVVVVAGTGQAVRFELWAPLDRWDEVAAVLESVPGIE